MIGPWSSALAHPTPCPGAGRRMPLPLLVALFLAFGLDPASRPGPMSFSEALARTGEVGGGLLAVAGFAFLVGRVVAWRVVRRGRASSRVRRAYALGVRTVD